MKIAVLSLLASVASGYYIAHNLTMVTQPAYTVEATTATKAPMPVVHETVATKASDIPVTSPPTATTTGYVLNEDAAKAYWATATFPTAQPTEGSTTAQDPTQPAYVTVETVSTEATMAPQPTYTTVEATKASDIPVTASTPASATTGYIFNEDAAKAFWSTATTPTVESTTAQDPTLPTQPGYPTFEAATTNLPMAVVQEEASMLSQPAYATVEQLKTTSTPSTMMAQSAYTVEAATAKAPMPVAQETATKASDIPVTTITPSTATTTGYALNEDAAKAYWATATFPTAQPTVESTTAQDPTLPTHPAYVTAGAFATKTPIAIVQEEVNMPSQPAYTTVEQLKTTGTPSTTTPNAVNDDAAKAYWTSPIFPL